METTTPRQRARLETEAQITRIGNEMVDEGGVEALSLRAVARELGVVSSAVYRYVKSRDELLTILIRDAFIQLADEVDRALEAERSIPAVGLTMLDWSRRHPNRWALIYGTPITDYQAPREETVVPGTRVMVALTEIVRADGEATAAPTKAASRDDAARADTAAAGISAEALQPLRAGFEELGVEVSDALIMEATTVWVAIIGLINSLRFGQFGPGFDSVEDDLMRGLISTLRS